MILSELKQAVGTGGLILVGVVPIAPRKDVRRVKNKIATYHGLEIDFPESQIEHILKAHTVEHFDPVKRLGEIRREGNNHITSFAKPRSVTNSNELYTLIKQALSDRKKTSKLREGLKGDIVIKLRNQKWQLWIGPQRGTNILKVNSIYPIDSKYVLTKAEIVKMVEDINIGRKSLDEIRRDLMQRFRRK